MRLAIFSTRLVLYFSLLFCIFLHFCQQCETSTLGGGRWVVQWKQHINPQHIVRAKNSRRVLILIHTILSSGWGPLQMYLLAFGSKKLGAPFWCSVAVVWFPPTISRQLSPTAQPRAELGETKQHLIYLDEFPGWVKALINYWALMWCNFPHDDFQDDSTWFDSYATFYVFIKKKKQRLSV